MWLPGWNFQFQPLTSRKEEGLVAESIANGQWFNQLWLCSGSMCVCAEGLCKYPEGQGSENLPVGEHSEIWGAWCDRRRQGSSTYLLYTFSVDLFHLGVSELCACVCSQSCLTLCDPLETVAHQAPLSMGFSRQEYCSGFSCPPSGDLPNPGMEPASLASPPLTGGFFTAAAPEKFLNYILL